MITIAGLLGLNWLLGSVICGFAFMISLICLPENPSKAEERGSARYGSACRLCLA